MVRYFSLLWLWLAGAVIAVIFGVRADWGSTQWIILAVIVFPGLLRLFNFVGTRKLLARIEPMTYEQRERYLESLDEPLRQRLRNELRARNG